MSGQKLAQIAADLLTDLEEIGFGTEREVSGANLVDLMSEYHSRLRIAVNNALGRNVVRQEALPLD